MAPHVIGLGTEFLRVRDALLETELGRTREQLLDAVAPLGARMQRVIETRGAFGELAVSFQDVFEQMAVRPHAVRRIAGVFLTLQPVAVDDVDRDLAHRVGPDEQIPTRQRRRGQRSQIGKHQAAQLLHRIGFQLGFDLVLVLHWAIQAFAVRAVEPSVIGAAQSAFVRNAKLHVDRTVQASIADESKIAAAILVEDQILAEHPHLAHRIFQKLSERRDRNPIAAHEFAAGCAGADAGQPLVGFRAQHGVSLMSCWRECRTHSSRRSFFLGL